MEKRELMFYILGSLAIITMFISFFFISGSLSDPIVELEINWIITIISILLFAEASFPYILQFNEGMFIASKIEAILVGSVIYGIFCFIIRGFLWNLDIKYYLIIGGVIIIGIIYLFLNEKYIEWLGG